MDLQGCQPDDVKISVEDNVVSYKIIISFQNLISFMNKANKIEASPSVEITFTIIVGNNRGKA